jgi:hypothetical protein
MKIRPVGSELFHAYIRTDVTKVMVAFRKFAKALNKTTNFYSFLNKLFITVLQAVTFAFQFLDVRNYTLNK